MIELVQNEPGLLLSEIREQLYDSSGKLLSIEAVHCNLVERLLITLKKAGTNNICKSLVGKFAYIERMQFFPSEWLVFTGKPNIHTSIDHLD